MKTLLNVFLVAKRSLLRQLLRLHWYNFTAITSSFAFDHFPLSKQVSGNIISRAFTLVDLEVILLNGN